MAAFDFPSTNLSEGDSYTKNNVKYIWDGTKWRKSGGLVDGDYGDITVSNGGSTFTIDRDVINRNQVANNSIGSAQIIDGEVGSNELASNSVTTNKIRDDQITTNKIQDDQITYSKIQNVSTTNRVLGRDSSGAGSVEEISPADLRTMINVADGADVTSSNSINALNDVDTTGVADNKILKYQASSSKFVIADDSSGAAGSTTFTGLSDSPINYTGAAGKTLKVNSTADAVEFVDVDSAPQLAGDLDVQTNKITTTTTNGSIKLDPNGTGVVEIYGDGTTTGDGGTLELKCSNGTHGVKIKSPPHSSAASYTLTLPDDDGNANQVLKTDGTGGLSWVDQTTDTDTTYTAGSGLTLTGTTFSVNTLNQDTTGSAATLTTPRNIAGVAFDGSADITLNNSSITNGANYIDGSALNASNLSSGTVPDARFPATLPAVSGANLTNLPAQTDATKLPLTGGTLTGSVTFEDAINENVYTITDGANVDLDPDNGMIQQWTLAQNRTATESLTAGQSMMLMVAAGNNTLTFPTITWVGGTQPTLATSGYTVIEIWHTTSTLYGAAVGDVA